MLNDFTRRESAGKSRRRLKKPRSDFPLGIHQGSGYWCKKVKGRVFYFGKVADDPKGKAALEQWLDEKDDLLEGREPREITNGQTVGDLCNEFLAAKEGDVETGELGPRSWRAYHDSCAALVKVLGRNRVVTSITPANLRVLRTKLSKGRGLVALGNELTKVRSIFLFALDEKQIAIPYKKALKKPKAESIRCAKESHRSDHGDRMFQACDLRQILAEAKQPLKSMVLLAANCAFGQTDLANLPTRAVNLETGWVDFARVKTAVLSRIPLWPETIAAIREWLPSRPKAKDSADSKLLFLTVRGARWVTVSERGTPKDAVSQEFNKVLTKLGLKKKRLSFYALRHGFQTVGSRAKDDLAVNSMMGHVDNSMSARYREGGVDEDRLIAVVNFVRSWLFAGDPPALGDETTLDAAAPEPSEQTTVDNDEAPTLKLFAG